MGSCKGHAALSNIISPLDQDPRGVGYCPSIRATKVSETVKGMQVFKQFTLG